MRWLCGVLLTLPRPGFLMDGARYTDTGCPGGCDASLRYPYPVCVYDVPRHGKWGKNAWRNMKIVARRAEGALQQEIAAEFGVARQTVSRVLKEAVSS